MLTRRNLFFLTILLTVMFYMMPRYEAEAMDPISMAVIAPIAIQGAKMMMPHVIRSFGNMSRVFIRASAHLVEFFLLPVGLFETTFLAYWRWRYGLRHMLTGAIAPFKFCGWM